MTKETKVSVHPEGGIYKMVAYTPKLSVYPNNSDMNGVGGIDVSLSLIINQGDLDG